MLQRTILIIVSNLGSFISNRLQIAILAKSKGYNVHVAFGEFGKGKKSKLINKGIKSHFLNMKRGFSNPFNEIFSLIKIYKLISKIKPDVLHLVTIKPYLFGGIVARITNTKAVISAVAGLGSLFIQKDIFSNFFRKSLYPLFKIAFGHKNQKIILQNKDDKKLLINWGVLKPSKAIILNGSGVNLSKFKNFKENKKKKPIITFIARLIHHKGILEFVSAAKHLNKIGIHARFWIVGEIDPENPSSLKKKDIDELKKNKFLEFKGYQKNMIKIYSKSNIICLPSYREGMSLTLLEASAAGRAIVTTNVPGCRDAIIPYKTGLLVPAKNAKVLANSLKYLIKNDDIRMKMGRKGRIFAKKNFDIKKIVVNHLIIYKDLLS